MKKEELEKELEEIKSAIRKQLLQLKDLERDPIKNKGLIETARRILQNLKDRQVEIEKQLGLI